MSDLKKNLLNDLYKNAPSGSKIREVFMRTYLFFMISSIFI